MANDRSIIAWDVNGFRAKSYVEIFNMLLENFRAIYGGDIDLTVETAFGEELRMQAEMLYDFAKLAEDVYYSVDANNAKGAMLDNIVSWTSNIIRKSNVQTILTADLKFAGEDITLMGNTIYVQDEYNVLWKAESLDITTKLTAGATIALAPANKVKLTCTSYGENRFNTNAVQILVNNSFHSNQVTLTNKIYTQIGSILETDEMLRQRKNNVLSHNSKTLIDSIKDYIIKNIHSIKDVVIYNANGRASSSTEIDSDGNTVINLLLSTGAEPMTILKHDLFVILQPQEEVGLTSFIDEGVISELSKAIAQVLKNKITPGIATAAEILVSDGLGGIAPLVDANYIEVTLPEGALTERYNFYIARPYSPTITITLATQNNYDSSSTQARIREAILNLSRTYSINRDINLGAILTTVMNCNLDPSNPTFIPTSITVGSGSPDELKVNNGYWLVDASASDMNIVISDGSVPA